MESYGCLMQMKLSWSRTAIYDCENINESIHKNIFEYIADLQGMKINKIAIAK